MVTRAIVRPPSRSYCSCISSHPEHNKLDLNIASEQHRNYVEALIQLGIDVIEIPPLDDYPDACFVEDTAVIHGNKALIARPTPVSRQGEVHSIEQILQDYFEIERVKHPATLEGGDVIHTENCLISGVTQRTSHSGVQQMREALKVQVLEVENPDIVHLKSYVTYLGEGVVIGGNMFSDHPEFQDFVFLKIPDSELYASNTLTINGTVIIPHGYPETQNVLREAGYDVLQLHTTEFARCEGALTCLSIIF
ncbi:MAG: dimethylarginine dimethylaminohydrolase family protein [Candidatus Thorarchaeota archaeon]